jgi:hypothetical protein
VKYSASDVAMAVPRVKNVGSRRYVWDFTSAKFEMQHQSMDDAAVAESLAVSNSLASIRRMSD